MICVAAISTRMLITIRKEKKKWITLAPMPTLFLELKFIQKVAETTTDGVSPPAAFDDRIKRMNSGRETHSIFW